MLTLSMAAEAMQGILTSADAPFMGVVSDSRHIKAHDLFFALEGVRHDGHQFAKDALAKGAAGIVAHKKLGLGEILVNDTKKALLALAAFWRNHFAIPVVAVTGSCGKTTVKEMIAHLLPGKVHKTPGNWNNDIGLPLSLLSLRQEHDYAVFEVGMNQPGEIALLASILKPDIAVITNIYPAHLQGLGSLQAIAAEKASLFDALPPKGIAIINADDEFLPFFLQHTQGKTAISAGFAEHADIRGFMEDKMLWARTPHGEWLLSETSIGHHEALNMLLSFAVLWALQPLPSSQPAFGTWQGVPQRLTLRRGKNGMLILDDTYNANPGSMAAAIDVLAGYPGKKILIFGDMGELGDEAPYWHRWVGEYGAKAGIDMLWTAGDLARLAHETFGGQGYHFPDILSLLSAIDAHLTGPSTILVKASRAMHFEQVVQALEETPCS